MTLEQHAPVVVMGVAGCGKSFVGAALAQATGARFIEGDRLHPEENIALMAAGIPLTDQNREGWLDAVGHNIAANLASGDRVVATCSALKRRYRDILREHAPDVYIVEPWGPIEVVARRVNARTHEYMPPTLLQSQYDTLESLYDDERGIRISIAPPPEQIVDEVVRHYRAEVPA